MKRHLVKALLATAALWGGSVDASRADHPKLPAGEYTGAGQVMILTHGEPSYGSNLSICHIRITQDGSLLADFPGERASLTLKITHIEPRMVWTITKGDKTFQATAIPFSPELHAFRLEILKGGKLIGGAQQFFSVAKRTVPDQTSGTTPR